MTKERLPFITLPLLLAITMTSCDARPELNTPDGGGDEVGYANFREEDVSNVASPAEDGVDYAYLRDEYVPSVSPPPAEDDIRRRSLIISKVNSDAHSLASTYPDKRMRTILEILAEISGKDPCKFDVNESVEHSPLELDSIDAVEVLITMEFVFDIKLSDSDYDRFTATTTPMQLFQLAKAHVP